MKPANFPGRKLRRVAWAKARLGLELTTAESRAISEPKDVGLPLI